MSMRTSCRLALLVFGKALAEFVSCFCMYFVLSINPKSSVAQLFISCVIFIVCK